MSRHGKGTPITTRAARMPPDLVSARVQSRKPWAKVRRFGRWLDGSWPVMFPRRSPGIAAWGFVAVLLTAQLAVFDRPRKRPEYVPSESDRRVESMARVAVERSLEVIGHGVRVSRVTVEPVYWWAAATYCYDTQAICFANDQLFSADEMLQTAAHETVHAIFDQAGLNPWSGSPAHDSRALVEEVAAAVLGAHIAGRVRALGGVDGSDLTRRMVAEYRYHCDVNAPGSLRRKIWARSLRLSYDIRIPRDLADAVAIHFGPLEMIDTMDRICRDNPDPWVTAHLIAERFMEPIPEPVEVPPFQGTAAQ